jgi:hypothetical protein
LIATLAFHYGAKSSDIGQSAGKRSAFTESTFPDLDRVFGFLEREQIPNSSNKRAYLSIDAISHKDHVLIDPSTGEVPGLTEPLVFNHETALLLNNDSDVFAQFVRHHAHKATKFSFVVDLIPLNPRAKAFPMGILLPVHGDATDDTFAPLSFARKIAENGGGGSAYLVG